MKKVILTLSCVCAVLFAVSCGSTPVAEPEVKDVVEETKEDVKEEVKEEVAQAADYSTANKTLLALTDAARENAVASGAEKYFSEKFASAEEKYTIVKNNVETDSSKDYSAEIKDLTERYQSLASASQAKALKEKADELSLADENKSLYEAGQKALEEYSALSDETSGADFLAKANEALNAYSNVVNKGLKANAARERQAALEAKKNADSVKAGVAKKEQYTKASETFKKADSSYVTTNIEGAFKGYKEAKEAFNSLYEEIKEKRAAAQALIDAAKQKVADSENYAVEADSIAPLEGEVAGIEAEDAVLLEEDSLANPDEAVIDVESGVTAKTAEKVAETAIAAEDAVNSAVEEAAAAVESSVSSDSADAANVTEAQ